MERPTQPSKINVETVAYQFVQIALQQLAEETGIDLSLLQALEILMGTHNDYEAQVSPIKQSIETQIGHEGLLIILQQL